jgi:hypothetical protein
MAGRRSARARRRLLYGGAALATVAGIAALVVFLPHAERQPEHFRNVPADVPAATPRTVAAPAALRKALALRTAEFVRTAVKREDLAASWKLVHPGLKQGLTRRQWLTGAIPVVPFPAVGIAEWHVDWSYADDIAADVLLVPEPKSGLYRKSFTIEFKRVKGEPDDRWLVYSWVPNGVSDALVQNEHAEAVQAALDKVQGHRGLSVDWVLIPIGIILCVFMLPLVVFLVDRRRLKRAERAHREALEARYSSSSRPS